MDFLVSDQKLNFMKKSKIKNIKLPITFIGEKINNQDSALKIFIYHQTHFCSNPGINFQNKMNIYYKNYCVKMTIDAGSGSYNVV